ncbi:hypothetical protein D3C85_1264130 [compost metagenome]
MHLVMRRRRCALSLSTLWRKSARIRILIKIGYRHGSRAGANTGHSKDWIWQPMTRYTIPNWVAITAFGIVQTLVRIPNQV